MTFNMIKIVGVVAFVTSSGSAFAGSSPFCYGGSPTPKYVCDAIKANQKPNPAFANQNLKAQGAGLSAGRVGR